MKRLLPGVLTLLIAGGSPPADQSGAVAFLHSGEVLPTSLPFSEAVRVGNLLYVSGHLGNQPGTSQLVSGGIGEEAKQALENLKTSLEAHGSSMDNVVQCTVILVDMSEWPVCNDVYKTFFTTNYPAQTAFGASGLALGARVEVECIAAVEK